MENKDLDLLWMKKIIFAGVFIQENKLHAAYDRFGFITCKQWLLLAVLQVFDDAPDLSSVGEAMGCSRQNVKKLALSLESDGYLELNKSESDSRSLCIYRTNKYYQIMDEIEKIGVGAHEALFREFTEEEIKQYYELSNKLNNGIKNVDEFFIKIKEKK